MPIEARAPNLDCRIVGKWLVHLWPDFKQRREVSLRVLVRLCVDLCIHLVPFRLEAHVGRGVLNGIATDFLDLSGIQPDLGFYL